MKKILIPLILALSFTACDQQRENDTDDMDEQESVTTEDESAQLERTIMNVEVEQLWATDTMMLTSESVLYNPDDNLLYVSNINGQPTEKDGNGFIATMNTQGEIINGYWFSGSLNAPKGMAISDGKLYVTDIDRLVEVDLETRVSSQIWEIDTAQFLNDIVEGPDGALYFSDTNTNTIYKYHDGEISVFLQNAQLKGPNGLYIENGQLMVATMNGGELMRINMDNMEMTSITSEIGAGDGLVPMGDGRMIASSWNGRVFIVDQDGTKQTILDTREENMNSADIEYVPTENMLIVPTFNDNRVVAYRISISE